MKISVILPTYRKNSKEELDNLHNYFNYLPYKNTLGEEFKTLYYLHTKYEELEQCFHILEPTIDCLISQIFNKDDYEILICHKYPDDINDLLRYYKDERFPKIKVINEKSSIWHELGDYPTVNNNRNSGILEAQGELLFFLDDMCIFNENLLQKIWDNYKDGYYTTCKVFKRIQIKDDKIVGTEKFKGLYEGIQIPNAATWTYGMSVSMKECLKINAFDEIYDGSFGGTDMDFGRRLFLVSNYKRKLGQTIYEFSHYHQQIKNKRIRNDEIFRKICGQAPIPLHIRANSWKPTIAQINKYKRWHLKNIDELDVNWNKFMDVPLYDLEEMRNEIAMS